MCICEPSGSRFSGPEGMDIFPPKIYFYAIRVLLKYTITCSFGIQKKLSRILSHVLGVLSVPFRDFKWEELIFFILIVTHEEPLEKEMATHSRILGLENPMDRGACSHM